MNSRALWVIAGLMGVGALPGGTAWAQRPGPAGGQLYELGGGRAIEIFSCRGSGSDQECDAQHYNSTGDEEGIRMWWPVYTLPRVGPVGAAAPAAPRAGATPGTQREPKARKETPPASPAASAQGCNYTPPAGQYSDSSPPSAGLFKRKIFDSYARMANGTGVAPLRAGVAFETFKVGAPITNRVTVVPGQGATRVTNGAPPNTALYPVKTRYMVCEEYRDGTKRRLIENHYYCFKNREQAWLCGGGEGLPKITELP